jgi:septal ring factor EnvC (AmiA/AmiB activator)
MFDISTLKPFAFGALAIGAVWFGFAVKDKVDYLEQAKLQIDSARVQIHLAKQDIDSAKQYIDLTRTYLADIRKAALDAKNDLSRLQEERNKIYVSIDKTIANSLSNLKEQERSIKGILGKQRAMLDSLNAIPIKNLIIEPSKKTGE